ncbi:MAG: type II secretion system F family protein [Candidatus Delongbacteria bacterium]
MASFHSREQLLLPRLKLLHTCASRSLSLEAALEGVLHSRGPVAGRRFSARFLQGLKAGRGVAEALREADPTQPGMVLSLVAVGERTGQLALCTRYLVDYYERVAELRRSLSRALTYPLIVLGFIWISLEKKKVRCIT